MGIKFEEPKEENLESHYVNNQEKHVGTIYVPISTTFTYAHLWV
jgi:hypothetical protein